ncbi:MAG TPA: SMP-30/gluconolactonase/LRE family protein [Chthonomonadales bacterium]|nr:SMP-30/gluconolactonase/LRE family protein [Chthonomonadales bacterium]
MKTELLAMVTILLASLLISAFSTVADGEVEPTLQKVCDGAEFPEGPAYDGKGNLYFSNCGGDYITRVSADGTVTRKWMTAAEAGPNGFKKTNGMAFYKDGSLFVCDFQRNAIIRIYPDRHCEMVIDRFEGKPLTGPNDLAFDPHGNLYFTAPGGSNKENPIGVLYRLELATRKLTKVADGMAFPNGLAFTADAKHLYVCESWHDRILRFAVRSDGTLGPKEVFADLSPDGPGQPDGMAVDAKGNLWVTHYGRHTVLVVNSKGKIVRTIRLPHTQEGGPTNIEFAGRDMKSVYITDPGANALWKMRSDTPGLPLFCAPENTAKE